jgi:hypothetical protein
VDLTLPDGGQVSVRIGETACRVGSDGDAALTLRCSLRGTAAQLPAGWAGTAEERQALQDALARWAEDCLTQCAAQCRSLGADPLELARRAGLTGTAEEMQVRVTARAVVEE